MAVQHREQHRQPPAVKTQRGAARITTAAAINQRLHLDQERARAFPHRKNGAARLLSVRAREENRRRVAHRLQAILQHGEHPQLIDRAEAVLHRAQHAEAAARLAFKIQHRIDHMLQHAGAGNRALLGNVADEKNRRAARLGKAHQLRCALAQLADRTRRGRKRLAVKRLNRIDHQHRRLLRRGRCQNTLNLRFTEKHDALACQSQPLGAQPNLARRLLTADVQTRHRLRQMMYRLQQQRRFADARIATNQYHAAAYQPAAKDAVKLADAARHQRFRLQLHRI